tara:strand:- start:2891 stop:4618 length:1728 start_codon:yes stop_codon:yes gene_type:complete
MANLISPGIAINEIDLTSSVQPESSTIGAIVGDFRWGPVEEITLVSSETELAAQFGKPDENNFKDYYVAASFLNYSNALKVYRGQGDADSQLVNAVSGVATLSPGYAVGQSASPTLIKNKQDFDAKDQGTTLGAAPFYARYAGALGNSLRVVVAKKDAFDRDSGTFDTANNFTAESLFDSSPNRGAIAGQNSPHLHVAVLDGTGDITGTTNTVLEKFQYLGLSATGQNSEGVSSYLFDRINNESNWIFANDNASSVLQDSPTVHKLFTLGGGVDESPSSFTATEKATAYDTAFGNNKDTESIGLLISTDMTASNANKVIELAEKRKDCVAFVSPEVNATANVGTTAAQLTNVKSFAKDVKNSSFGVLDSTSVYVYDKHNDRFRYIPANGHIAGLCARTEQNLDAWISPAGFSKGQLTGVTKLAFNPNQAQRDELYKHHANPIVSFPGQGTVLFGDKTLKRDPSAFDRINVRRLMNTLQTSVEAAAKTQLFEFNDEFTRAQFRNLVEPFLRDVKGRRGITDFLVVCDESNNTAEVIDGNRFVADIFIKPNRSINFITLNFVATRTGVEFSEIVGTN